MTASASEVCLLGKDGVIQWYQSLLNDGVITPDEKQLEAVRLLQEMAAQMAAPVTDDKKGFIHSLKSRLNLAANTAKVNNAAHAAKCGLYFHGGVGRGKSFLMDGFYLQIPTEKKLRVHFHRFMLHFHEDMKRQKGQADPLIAVADSLADKFSLICFDEFHVSDIADAMILGRLLERLLERGVKFVLTSNYVPDALYPNGLARERFLPTIALLKERLRVFALDAGYDYRLRHHLQQGKAFFHPLNEEADTAMHDTFRSFACGIELPPQVKVGGRVIPAIARSSGIVWFSFDELCGGAYSPADYLTLTDRFGTVMLSEVPFMGDDETREAARRFTWLVDVLYDHRIKLVVTAAAAPDKLYHNGAAGEATRTQSRLIEMQSQGYWESAKTAVTV